MSSEIEVSRRLVELCAQCLNNSGYSLAHDELRALLDTPVVERQPVYEVQWNSIHGPEGWKVVDFSGYEHCQGPLWDRRISYTAPPELAGLQATIAQLTAENKALSEECGINDKEIEGLQSALSDAESEIDRLKSGHGEPVGIVAHRVNEIGQSFEGVIYATPILMGLVEDGTLLYAYPSTSASEDDKS